MVTHEEVRAWASRGGEFSTVDAGHARLVRPSVYPNFPAGKHHPRRCLGRCNEKLGLSGASVRCSERFGPRPSAKGAGREPGTLQKSRVVQGRSRMVFCPEPVRTEPPDRCSLVSSSTGWARQSAHVSRGFRRDEFCSLHSSKRCCSDRLQRTVFIWKVSACEEALFQDLPKGQLGQLAKALPYYQKLRVLRLRKFEVGREEAEKFGKAGPRSFGLWGGFFLHSPVRHSHRTRRSASWRLVQ